MQNKHYYYLFANTFFTRKLTYICYFELTHINTYELTTTHDGRGDGYERAILYLQILCSDGGETAQPTEKEAGQPTKKEAGGGTADGEGGGRRHALVRRHGCRERGDDSVGEAGAGRRRGSRGGAAEGNRRWRGCRSGAATEGSW